MHLPICMLTTSAYSSCLAKYQDVNSPAEVNETVLLKAMNCRAEPLIIYMVVSSVCLCSDITFEIGRKLCQRSLSIFIWGW